MQLPIQMSARIGEAECYSHAHEFTNSFLVLDFPRTGWTGKLTVIGHAVDQGMTGARFVMILAVHSHQARVQVGQIQAEATRTVSEN
jgi:hypothetical protein